MTIDYSHGEPTQRRGSPLLVVLAWAVVGIPALWGIAMTGRTAMQLFHSPPAHTSAPSAAAVSTGK